MLELEKRLTEVLSCLEAAENRAAELLAARAEMGALEDRLTAIKATRSWRVTAPLRLNVGRFRRLLGRPRNP